MCVLRFNPRSLLRAFAAATLTLALLSGALPLAVWSAAHSCSMPCCASVEGSCSTGACQGGLFKNHQPAKRADEACGTEDAHHSHGALAKQTPVASENSEHCDSKNVEAAPAEQPEAMDTASARPREQVSARTVSVPCSMDCCAGASASTQSRRWRDLALIQALAKSLLSCAISPLPYPKNLPSISSAHLKRLKARAPPASQSNSQA